MSKTQIHQCMSALNILSNVSVVCCCCLRVVATYHEPSPFLYTIYVLDMYGEPLTTSFPGSLMLASGSGKMRDPGNEVGPLTSNPIHLSMSFYFLLRLRLREFVETPSQATLLLTTYPLSMESVKVHLKLSLSVNIGCLYTSRTVQTFSSL